MGRKNKRDRKAHSKVVHREESNNHAGDTLIQKGSN